MRDQNDGDEIEVSYNLIINYFLVIGSTIINTLSRLFVVRLSETKKWAWFFFIAVRTQATVS